MSNSFKIKVGGKPENGVKFGGVSYSIIDDADITKEDVCEAIEAIKPQYRHSNLTYTKASFIDKHLRGIETPKVEEFLGRLIFARNKMGTPLVKVIDGELRFISNPLTLLELYTSMPNVDLEESDEEPKKEPAAKEEPKAEESDVDVTDKEAEAIEDEQIKEEIKEEENPAAKEEPKAKKPAPKKRAAKKPAAKKKEESAE